MGRFSDDSSFESLSFAGLVCSQEQKLKSPTPPPPPRKKRSDFVFRQTGDHDGSADSSSYPPADLLISNGEVIPQAFVIQRPRIVAANQPHHKQRRKSVGDKRGQREGSNRKKRNPKMEHSDTSDSGVGWKIVKSFVSPCRECKAVKPAVKTQTTQRENF